MLRQNSVDASDLPFHIRDLVYSRWWTADPDALSPTLIQFTFGGGGSTSLPAGFSNLTQTSDGLKDMVRLALGEWEKVANLRFVEVESDAADDSAPLIRIFTHDREANITDTPEPGAWVSEIHFGPSANQHPERAIVRHLVLHEIGHALGLWHPTGYDQAFDAAIAYDPTGNTAYTIMAYTPDFFTGIANAGTPGPYDIAAIQFLYGPNRTWNAGDTVYQADPADGGLYTIWDTGGHDVLDCSRIGVAGSLSAFFAGGRLTHTNLISLAPDSFSEVANWHYAIYRDVWIEDAIGSGAVDEIHDNLLDNRLYGMAGDDKIWVTGGNDSVDGGAGFDTLVLPGPLAAYRIAESDGICTIDDGAAAIRVSNVERLELADAALELRPQGNLVTLPSDGDNTVCGSDHADEIRPGAGDDVVVAGAGNDTIADESGDGVLCGGAGADSIVSGAGSDLLIGGEGRDTLLSGDGSDTLYGEGGEDLVDAGAGDDLLIAGPGADTLLGGAGADYLDGGAGTDLYVGGPGGDLFVVTPPAQPVTVIADYEAGDRLVLHWANRGQVFADPAQGVTAVHLGSGDGVDCWIFLIGQAPLDPADIILL